MILKYLIAWFPMVIIGILNGVLRKACYETALGELRAHQVSTLSGVILFGLYIWLLSRQWHLESSQQAFLVGVIWLLMTVGFEFLFGHFVAGHSWNRLLHDYNIFEGRLWVLILIWITIAPYCFYRLQD
jgi:uncharacterized BrkB/YihY/UPF0761 family membrane protein